MNQLTTSVAAQSVTTTPATIESVSLRDLFRSNPQKAEELLQDYHAAYVEKSGLPADQQESLDGLRSYLTKPMRIKKHHSTSSMDVMVQTRDGEVVGGAHVVQQRSTKHGKLALHIEQAWGAKNDAHDYSGIDDVVAAVKDRAHQEGFKFVIEECERERVEDLMTKTSARDGRVYLAPYTYIQPSLSDDPKEVVTTLHHVVHTVGDLSSQEKQLPLRAINAYYRHWEPEGSLATDAMGISSQMLGRKPIGQLIPLTEGGIAVYDEVGKRTRDLLQQWHDGVESPEQTKQRLNSSASLEDGVLSIRDLMGTNPRLAVKLMKEYRREVFNKCFTPDERESVAELFNYIDPAIKGDIKLLIQDGKPIAGSHLRYGETALGTMTIEFYLAVEPGSQGKGIGTSFYQSIRQAAVEDGSFAIGAEMNDPYSMTPKEIADDTIIRPDGSEQTPGMRRGFWKARGRETFDAQYCQPSLGEGLPRAPYLLVSLEMLTDNLKRLSPTVLEKHVRFGENGKVAQISKEAAMSIITALYENIGEGIDYRSEVEVIKASMKGRSWIGMVELDQKRPCLDTLPNNEFRKLLSEADQRKNS